MTMHAITNRCSTRTGVRLSSRTARKMWLKR